MNAFEQIKSLSMITKVEAIVHSFRSLFPGSFADLKPWVDNDETKLFNDPNSIDIGFHFTKFNSLCQCRSILMQVRIHYDSGQENCSAINIEMSGFEAFQEQWRFSTVEDGIFSGSSQPKSSAKERLRQACSQILHLFNQLRSVGRES